MADESDVFLIHCTLFTNLQMLDIYKYSGIYLFLIHCTCVTVCWSLVALDNRLHIHARVPSFKTAHDAQSNITLCTKIHSASSFVFHCTHTVCRRTVMGFLWRWFSPWSEHVSERPDVIRDSGLVRIVAEMFRLRSAMMSCLRRRSIYCPSHRGGRSVCKQLLLWHHLLLNEARNGSASSRGPHSMRVNMKLLVSGYFKGRKV